ncbi:MAG: CaiB/BaiF CoA transferase family protein [Acidimicrobiales bacterium]
MADRDEFGARPPLAGIRVLEVAQNIAVPYCGWLLAGLGADVVKVEPAEGDAMRFTTSLPVPDGATPEGRIFSVVNRNKRSIVVDLAHPEAADAIRPLVGWSDVVLVALKPNDVERYGLGADTIHRYDPTTIVLDHRPFGAEGPYGAQGGYDILMQGMSGMAVTTGRAAPGGHYPATVRPAFNDFGTGMLSALGVVAALRQRDVHGRGQTVTASLLATALNFMSPLISRFEAEPSSADLWAAADPGPAADFEEKRTAYEATTVDSAALGLYFRHFQTADGFVSIGCLSPALRRRFHTTTGVPTPAEAGVSPGDPGWAELIAQAETVFRNHPTDAWLERLHAAGCPAARLNLPHEALDDPQVAANGFRSDLDHPRFGRHRVPAYPLRLSGSVAPPERPAPILDHDTVEVLLEAGLTDLQVRDLQASGLVGRVEDRSAAPAARREAGLDRPT